jgi:hypothetical protein
MWREIVGSPIPGVEQRLKFYNQYSQHMMLMHNSKKLCGYNANLFFAKEQYKRTWTLGKGSEIYNIYEITSKCILYRVHLKVHCRLRVM